MNLFPEACIDELETYLN